MVALEGDQAHNPNLREARAQTAQAGTARAGKFGSCGALEGGADFRLARQLSEIASAPRAAYAPSMRSS